MTEQSLEAPNSASSTPTEEVNTEVEQGEIEAPQEQAPEEEVKAEQPKPEPTEVEKVKMAMQKRIDRQTAAFKAQEEQLRHLQSELQAMKATAPKQDEAPKQDDYKSYDEWEQATIEWKANQKVQERIREEKEKEVKAAQERQQQETRKVFEEKEKAFRTVSPDYDIVAQEAVVELNTLAQAGANIMPLRDMVMSFDNPPEMLYQLGKEPSLIEDLVSMPPVKAMRELVKLEIALKGAAKAEPEQAPEPVKPVGSKGGVKPLDRRSPAEILAWAKNKS